VPPLVKKIVVGVTPSNCATFLRAASTPIRAILPTEYVEDGLPNVSFMKGNMTVNTSLSMGVVAALSKYIGWFIIR
jgi:hypothetical protein